MRVQQNYDNDLQVLFFLALPAMGSAACELGHPSTPPPPPAQNLSQLFPASQITAAQTLVDNRWYGLAR